MTCRRFTVVGRVQGVNFRASTVTIAQQLGLSGWVRNISDGTVELVACGDDARLRDLEKWLWQGPPAAQVDSVAAVEAANQHLTGFSVR